MYKKQNALNKFKQEYHRNKAYYDKMFEENEKLVYFVLNKYFRKWDSDMRQQGLFLLLQACVRFDDTKECKFSTFATNYIKFGLFEYCKNQKPKAITISIDLCVSGYEDDYIDFKIEPLICKSKHKDVWRLISKGFNEKEISKMMGVSYSKIRRIVSREKNVLQNYIKTYNIL